MEVRQLRERRPMLRRDAVAATVLRDRTQEGRNRYSPPWMSLMFWALESALILALVSHVGVAGQRGSHALPLRLPAYAKVGGAPRGHLKISFPALFISVKRISNAGSFLFSQRLQIA